MKLFVPSPVGSVQDWISEAKGIQITFDPGCTSARFVVHAPEVIVEQRVIHDPCGATLKLQTGRVLWRGCVGGRVYMKMIHADV